MTEKPAWERFLNQDDARMAANDFTHGVHFESDGATAKDVIVDWIKGLGAGHAFHVAEIQQHTGLAPSTIRNALKELEEVDLLVLPAGRQATRGLAAKDATPRQLWAAASGGHGSLARPFMFASLDEWHPPVQEKDD